jgi:hypothetical protein
MTVSIVFILPTILFRQSPGQKRQRRIVHGPCAASVKYTRSIPEKRRGVIGEERILDQQKDRLKGGLSRLLLYEVYDKCGCNALSFFTAGVLRRVQ